MPSLTNHHASSLFKLLLIGDSGVGKTSSLAALAKAGYYLHILDMDNGLDPLTVLLRPHPEAMARVDYLSFRDRYKSGPAGPRVSGTPKAYVNAVKALNEWQPEEDGPATVPAEWGPEHILVIDSFTALSSTAFEWAKGLNPTAKDPRQWYGAAQESLLAVLSLLTSEDFNSNVIILSHITYSELQTGETKGFPSALGQALGHKIGRFFNSLVVAETRGSGQKLRRELRLVSSGVVDAKTPVASSFDAPLPLEDGLVTLTNKLKGQ